MGFLDSLKNLTRSYDEDDDFFEEADESFKAPTVISDAQKNFENTYSASSAAEPELDEEESSSADPGSFFGGFKLSSRGKSQRDRSSGADTQVILFAPKNFDECGELANHILSGHSVVMTLDTLDSDLARRLLDFMSGIAYALQGKLTPISGRTYFVTPQNVDIIGTQSAPVEH